MNADTPADTDHVPSFAAKTFVVREAPPEFHPPGYEAPAVFPSVAKQVEVPRTKFFCEEQSYLPGIYADVQLGCKVSESPEVPGLWIKVAGWVGGGVQGEATFRESLVASQKEDGGADKRRRSC